MLIDAIANIVSSGEIFSIFLGDYAHIIFEPLFGPRTSCQSKAGARRGTPLLIGLYETLDQVHE